VLEYEVDGHILTLTPTGTSTPEHRLAVFNRIRRDPNVPSGALLFVNARKSTETFDHKVLSDLITLMIQTIGPKLAPVCAVIFPASYAVEGHLYRSIAAKAGLRVGLFQEESAALAWLSAYRPEEPTI
jgi:hypothetical protein